MMKAENGNKVFGNKRKSRKVEIAVASGKVRIHEAGNTFKKEEFERVSKGIYDIFMQEKNEIADFLAYIPLVERKIKLEKQAQ